MNAVSCFDVFSCEKYWSALLRSQTIRAGVTFNRSVKKESYFDFCGSLIVGILSGREFRYFAVLWKNEYL